MNNKGINYIETIIAFAIFIISVVALLSVFLQSGLNYRYSTNKYEAALLAESILEDVETLLPKAVVQPSDSEYVPMSVFLDGGFSEYQDAGFNITILLKRVTSANLNCELDVADIAVSTAPSPDTGMNRMKLSIANKELFDSSAIMYAVMVVVKAEADDRSLCIMTDLVSVRR